MNMYLNPLNIFIMRLGKINDVTVTLHLKIRNISKIGYKIMFCTP